VRARRDQVVMGAVAAAVLVAIVAFAAASGVKPQARPTPTPPPPAPRGDRPLFGGSLEPGVRYRTRAFVPALSFAVGDTEWIVDNTTLSDRLVLERRLRTGEPGGELDARSYLVFSHVEVAATELYGVMKRRPELDVGPRRPVLVAGVPGDRFDVTVHFSRRPRGAACRPLLLICTALAPNRYIADGARMRTTVLITDPDAFVIAVIGDTQRDLDKIEAPAADVLQTLEIGVR
jgi:hypothetical protein